MIRKNNQETQEEYEVCCWVHRAILKMRREHPGTRHYPPRRSRLIYDFEGDHHVLLIGEDGSSVGGAYYAGPLGNYRIGLGTRPVNARRVHEDQIDIERAITANLARVGAANADTN